MDSVTLERPEKTSTLKAVRLVPTTDMPSLELLRTYVNFHQQLVNIMSLTKNHVSLNDFDKDKIINFFTTTDDKNSRAVVKSAEDTEELIAMTGYIVVNEFFNPQRQEYLDLINSPSPFCVVLALEETLSLVKFHDKGIRLSLPRSDNVIVFNGSGLIPSNLKAIVIEPNISNPIGHPFNICFVYDDSHKQEIFLNRREAEVLKTLSKELELTVNEIVSQLLSSYMFIG